MKTSFINITSGFRNKVSPRRKPGPRLQFIFWIPAFAGMTIGVTILLASLLCAFQLEQPFSDIQILESGQAQEHNVPAPLFHLSQGDYQKALEAMVASSDPSLGWLREYLERLIPVASLLERHESEHFILFTPAGQGFLAEYALPSMEDVWKSYRRLLGFSPKGKIRIEIYPNKEDFSKASTLTIPILENSGAIGICKFHRLMIMSPQTLPLGYRWLDALAHEYAHLMVNHLSGSKAELWIHEGTARYLETAYRARPPLFLTPQQKSDLKTAQEDNKLIPFQRMSPSLVYLKDQNEVSLAFSQVSHAVSVLIGKHGIKKYAQFLRMLQDRSFMRAFIDSFDITPEGFESSWQRELKKEPWDKTKGALSDEVRFQSLDEESVMGADAKGKVRLGDRMRRQGLMEGALIEYEKALVEEPDNAVILLKAARTELALGKKESAVAYLRKAVLKNPNYGTPYIELALLVEPGEAVGLYLSANAINPFDPRIHKGLSDCYQALGKKEQSRKERAIAQALGPL